MRYALNGKENTCLKLYKPGSIKQEGLYNHRIVDFYSLLCKLAFILITVLQTLCVIFAYCTGKY